MRLEQWMGKEVGEGRIDEIGRAPHPGPLRGAMGADFNLGKAERSAFRHFWDGEISKGAELLGTALESKLAMAH